MTNLSGLTSVPTHVPRELCWDHDIDAFTSQFEDPYVQACEVIHQGPDIIWAVKGAHGGRPGWVLTRFAHMQEVYIDSTRFSAGFSNGAARFLGFDLRLIPKESDPPLHRYYRQVLQPWFQPSAINSLEPVVRSICDELISYFADRSGCEFVLEFSSLFPSYVFLGLMGMPRELLPQFLEWEHSFLRGNSWEDQVAGTRAIYEYLRSYSEERRQNPGDDLVSKIVTAEVDGRKLTENEAIGMCMTLYLGGLDTVMNSLGWCMRHLAKDQVLQDRLRDDPDLISAAIEELLRAYGVSSTFRTVIEDIDFHGVPMRKGDIVALPTFFSSRDARQYPNPHVVDIDRKPRHLTMGSGVHNCLGIHLAKREIRIVLSEFLSRFSNIRIPGGEKEVLTTVMFWGVRKMPLVWDP